MRKSPFSEKSYFALFLLGIVCFAAGILLTTTGAIIYNNYVHFPVKQTNQYDPNSNSTYESIDLMERVRTALKAMNSTSVGMSLTLSISDVRAHRAYLYDLGVQLARDEVSTGAHDALCKSCQAFIAIRETKETGLIGFSEREKVKHLFQSTCSTLLCQDKSQASYLSKMQGYFEKGKFATETFLNDSHTWLTFKREECEVVVMSDRARYIQWLGLAELIASEINSGYDAVIQAILLPKRNVRYDSWIKVVHRMSSSIEQCKIATLTKSITKDKDRLNQSLIHAQTDLAISRFQVAALNETIQKQIRNETRIRKELAICRNFNEMKSDTITDLNKQLAEKSRIQAALNETSQEQIRNETILRQELAICSNLTDTKADTINDLNKELAEKSRIQVVHNESMIKCKTALKNETIRTSDLNNQLQLKTESAAHVGKVLAECHKSLEKIRNDQITCKSSHRAPSTSHVLQLFVIFYSGFVYLV